MNGPRTPAPQGPTTRTDLLIALTLTPLALLNRLFDTPWWALAAAAALLVAALTMHRRLPWAALATTLALALWTPNAVLAAAVIAFGIARQGVRPTRRAAALATALLGTLAGAFALLQWTSAPPTLQTLALLPLPVVLAWALGDHLRERADLRRRQAQGIAEQARLRERARIAGDMHDSLGHEIGLIAVRAGALQVDPNPTPESTREAAADLRAGAARAAERLRQVIGVLGTQETEPLPPHSTDDLLERARAAGMRVHLHAPGPHTPVPDLVQRTVHRLVQEALTNAAKHAPGARVDIEVEHTFAHTTLTVTNGPPAEEPPTPSTAPPGSGTGLVGLRERVRLSGGTLTAAPLGEGFQVNAHLPHTPGAAPGEPDHRPEDALPPHLVDRAWRLLRWDLARTIAITTALTAAIAALAAHYGW